MQLSYDGMVFDVLLLKDWLREAVYTDDKSTFLYWRHVIEVVTILNDEATNAEFFDGEDLGGEAADNRVGVAKDRGVDKNIFPALPKKRWDIRVDPGEGKPLPLRGGELGGKDGPILPEIDPRDLRNRPNIPGGAGVGAPGVDKVPEGLRPRPLVTGLLPRPLIPREVENGFGRPNNFPDVPPGVNKPFGFNDNLRVARVNRINHTIPTTDIEMRRRLAVPRRQLNVWMYTGVNGRREHILQSPQAGAGVDAKTGPICSITDCTEIHGQQTAVMHLRFETWEGPKIEFGGMSSVDKGRRVVNTPAILSHRWTMAFGFDPQTHLRVRSIEGEAILRADVMHLRKISADQLRPYFMCHKIPPGYVRVPDPNDMVRLNSDGTGVVYKITDKQQMTNFPAGAEWGMTKIEATSATEYSSSNAAEGILSFMKGFEGGMRKLPGAPGLLDFSGLNILRKLAKYLESIEV